MKRNNLLNQALLLSLSFLMWTCEWDGYQPEVDSGEEFYEETPENNELHFRDISGTAALYEIGEVLRSDVGVWGYKTGINWLEGAEYRDNAKLDVEVFKEQDKISIEITADVSEYEVYPEVWDSDFGRMDEGDYMLFNLVIRNNKSNGKIRFSESSAITPSGTVSCQFIIYSERLAKIKTGMLVFDLNLDMEFVSFFGDKSGVKPMDAKLKMDFDNPQFYHSKFYFKSMTLNKEVTDDYLGGNNDWNDPSPETSLSVRYEDQSVFFGHSQNSYSYFKSGSADIFHLDTNMMLDLNAVDLDYGFNGNDNICDTLISIRDLEGKEYHAIKMICVEELLVRTEFKGPAN